MGYNPMQDFWKNKKVLITGHTGFKGTWLVHWLKLMGAKVAGYALSPPTVLSLFELTDASKNMISVQGDVRDSISLLLPCEMNFLKVYRFGRFFECSSSISTSS